MTRISRRVFSGLLALLTTLFVVAPVAVAAAAGDDPTSKDTAIAFAWDGPRVELDWRGQQRLVASTTFIGDVVTAVPGDDVSHQATITNNGPSDAYGRVDFGDFANQNATDTVNQELKNIIEIYWDIAGQTGSATWAELERRDPVLSVALHVAQGASFPVKIGFRFPIDATGGRNRGQTSSVLMFTVKVTLSGDEIAPPTPTPSVPTTRPPFTPPPSLRPGPVVTVPATPTTPVTNPSAVPSPSPSARPVIPGENLPWGAIPMTGAIMKPWFVASAVFLVFCGAFLLILVKRRRGGEEDTENAPPAG